MHDMYTVIIWRQDHVIRNIGSDNNLEELITKALVLRSLHGRFED